MMMTFEQVVETIKELSPEQRKIIITLMHGWEIEALRYDIAQDAKASIKAFHRGELKAKPLEEVIEELRSSVEDLS